nr:MAG TPA: hypothetical protein [Caudoviricetes sp.]
MYGTGWELSGPMESTYHADTCVCMAVRLQRSSMRKVYP